MITRTAGSMIQKWLVYFMVMSLNTDVLARNCSQKREVIDYSKFVKEEHP